MDINDDIVFESTWKTLEQLLGANKGYQLVKHLLDSYNDFIGRKLDDIIDGFNPIMIHHSYLPDVEKFKYIMSISIKNPVLSKPLIHEKDGSTKLMTPTDARSRNFTYSAPLSCDIHISAQVLNENGTYTEENKKILNINLGRLPVMVNSKYCILSDNHINFDECRYDYGGYFIVNGNEKVVIPQDRIAENKTNVFLSNKVSSYSHNAEIRSVEENRFSVPKTTSLKLSAKPNQFGRYIRVSIHHIKHEIPLFILFRALGVESDQDIIKHIVYDIEQADNIVKELVGSVEEANMVNCKREAFEYLSKYMNINGYPREMLNNKIQRMEILKNVLENEFLPHVGPSFEKKALYLGFMAGKLLKCYMGILPYDDRDSYVNKRIDTPGILMANLFRQYYGKVIKDMKNMIQKDINHGSWKATNKFINVINKVNISKIIKSTIIESGLKYGLATGNWGIKSNKTKQGVAQVLNRMTFNATLSHLRRVNTPIEKTGKLVQPRKLHSTQWGIICPAETPEGVSVGLVKNLAMMASITISSNSIILRRMLVDVAQVCMFDGTNIEIFGKNTKVFINGDLIGTHSIPNELVALLKTWKRRGEVNVYTGIVWNIVANEIWICTEGGRCSRPLYIVGENNMLNINKDLFEKVINKKMSWMELVVGKPKPFVHSCIEYLDVEEVNTSMIAMKFNDLVKGMQRSSYVQRYSHLELDPSLMFGVMAASIPFANHNQSPRNCYQASMGKQAIGVYTSNYRKRYDTLGHVLNYGQKPLVSTRLSKILHGDALPSGMNCIVAIASYTGFNQEDAMIMNRSSVDRGMFVSTYYRTYKEQNSKNHSTGEEEYFCKPDVNHMKQIKPHNYSKLCADGFVPENTYVETGDVLIGKCMPQKNGVQIINKDTSVVLKNNEMGFVDKNCYNDKFFTNINGDGYAFAKVRLRTERVPTIGDKAASRYAQKGTVGMFYTQENMPFCAKDGLTPDIIINPHCIPSRMTIAQLLETIMGKACCHLGTFGDGTPFNDVNVENLADVLESCGMERYGNELMYNPRTGEQIATDIFIGPTYYQRLKHMVLDKIHSRNSSGPVVLLTRQPAEGRARDGGLRTGEMEVECMIAHGVTSFLKERLMEASDNYRVFVCKQCGMISSVNPDKNVYSCKYCNNHTQFSEIRIPYCFKLLSQEIQTMAIGTKFVTN